MLLTIQQSRHHDNDRRHGTRVQSRGARGVHRQEHMARCRPSRARCRQDERNDCRGIGCSFGQRARDVLHIQADVEVSAEDVRGARSQARRRIPRRHQCRKARRSGDHPHRHRCDARHERHVGGDVRQGEDPLPPVRHLGFHRRQEEGRRCPEELRGGRGRVHRGDAQEVPHSGAQAHRRAQRPHG